MSSRIRLLLCLACVVVGAIEAPRAMHVLEPAQNLLLARSDVEVSDFKIWHVKLSRSFVRFLRPPA